MKQFLHRTLLNKQYNEIVLSYLSTVDENCIPRKSILKWNIASFWVLFLWQVMPKCSYMLFSASALFKISIMSEWMLLRCPSYGKYVINQESSLSLSLLHTHTHTHTYTHTHTHTHTYTQTQTYIHTHLPQPPSLKTIWVKVSTVLRTQISCLVSTYLGRVPTVTRPCQPHRIECLTEGMRKSLWMRLSMLWIPFRRSSALPTCRTPKLSHVM